MTVGAAVGRAILLVVTFIVATKTLGVGSRQRFQEEAGKNLSWGGDDSVPGSGSLGVGAVKKSVFLREPRFRDKRGGRRGRSGRNSRYEGEGRRAGMRRTARCEGHG